MFGAKISKEEHLKAIQAKQAELDTAAARVTELEGELATAQGTITEKDNTIAAKETEITNLKAKVTELGGQIAENNPSDPPAPNADDLDKGENEEEFLSEADEELAKIRKVTQLPTNED